jgi:hypothetical protein
MPKLLSESALAQYDRDGCFFPVRVLNGEQVAASRKSLEDFESGQGKPVEGAQRSKSHLLFRWVDDLMRHSKILDGVEDLIGPDILCWNTLFWIKEAKSESFVSWHQDLRYWGLNTNDLVSVWLALSPATLESGCMRVLPGSPRGHFDPVAVQFHEKATNALRKILFKDAGKVRPTV